VRLAVLQTSGRSSVAPVSRDVPVVAARLRAQHATLKLPDTIHAARARAGAAVALVTNDRCFEAWPA
jgi:predicted nucleic acid-binding protein